MSDLPPNNIDNAFGVYLQKDGWYFYDWRGQPYGPYLTMHFAWDALDDYCYDYDREYED